MTAILSIPPTKKTIRRIAFRTGRGLGDAVLCEPLVRRLVKAYPAAHVTCLLPSSCKGIDRLGYAGESFQPWCEHESFLEIAADFDLLIDADPAQFLSPFREEIAGGSEMVRLFAHYRPEAERTTAYERMAEGLARIGVDAVRDVPRLTVPPEFTREAEDALGGLGLDSASPIITIHPGSNAGYAFKRWSADGFAFVADSLIERHHANVVVVGSGTESPLIEDIRSKMHRGDQLRVAYDWRLSDLAALLAASRLFIGNDSGVGHLAAALGRPTVTVAGPTFPLFWAPLTDRALVVDPRGCCYEPEKCGVACLKAIRPYTVVGAVEALLFATASDRADQAQWDRIVVCEALEIATSGDDSLTLRNAQWDLPLHVERGANFVRRFLRAVESMGSTQFVRAAFADADILLEQCLRHGIVLRGNL